MNVIVLTPPLVEPVSLDEIKLFLRVDGTPHPDDDMLEGMITAARQECEQLVSRAFVQQTLRVFHSGFPSYGFCCRSGYWPRIELIRPPMIQLLTVRYYDDAGDAQTISSSDYYVTDDLVPRVQFLRTSSFPTTQVRDDAVFVDYIAGYAPVDSNDLIGNIPKPIIHAIKIGVQLMYDELAVDKREALERQKLALLSPYRVMFV